MIHRLLSQLCCVILIVEEITVVLLRVGRIDIS